SRKVIQPGRTVKPSLWIAIRLAWQTCQAARYAGGAGSGGTIDISASEDRSPPTRWMRTSRVFTRPVNTTIVVAGGDCDLRSLYASSLRRAGHDVWEAADGGEALRLVRAHSPELLLLDIWMPVLNGLEVLEMLRGNPDYVGVKVVVLTQHDDADTH